MNTVYNHVADVVTDSWGDNGEAINPGQQQSDDQALLAGAAQGVTVLFSSGDDGDLDAPNGVASGSWPATSAYVTGVGGTTLLINDATGDKAEYGWGNYRAFLDGVVVNSAKSVTTTGVDTRALSATRSTTTRTTRARGAVSACSRRSPPTRPSWCRPRSPPRSIWRAAMSRRCLTRSA